MADTDASTVNIKGLDQILKALKAKPPVCRIGILGSTNARQGKSGVTNATVGAVHEFGAPGRNIPQRSFLRVPLTDNLEKYLEQAGAFDKDVLAEVIKQGSVIPWMKKVAATAKQIVGEAFDTGGFGRWPAWKDPNYTNEGGQLLVDTQSLRDSITTEVK
jgi:phage gpG-like protein